MKKIILYSLFFCTSFATLTAQDNGDQLFDGSFLHEIRITFPDVNFWDTLTFNYETFGPTINGGGDIPYLMGLIEVDGQVVDSIGVRQKGFSSHFSSNAFKKSLKIDLNEYVSGQNYDGLKKFNLHNGVGDPGFQRDYLCYNMMREAGVKAPRVTFCRLYLNDAYWGIYAITEQIDKTFLKSNFADGDGNLFKNTGNSDLSWVGSDPSDYSFELKTNKTENDWSEFIELVDVINNSTDSDFPNRIEEVFDVSHYLNVLAIDVMTDNWDSYLEHGRNFYLYHAPDTDQFIWIPWDYNLAMGGNLSSEGNPDPPLDSLCPIQAKFTATLNFATFQVDFTNISTPANLDSYSWTFGDSNTSTAENPSHTYAEGGTFQVCLTVTKMIDGNNCEQVSCQQINFEDNPANCETILNGSCPFPASDPIFQQVIEIDNFCCNNDWDNICQNIYNDIAGGGSGGGPGGPGGTNFPLIIDNDEKVLIDRLMAVPSFRQEYLDICCEILDLNFTLERLSPLIDHNANLIRDGIYADPNYIFTPNYFEYDIGDGTGNSNGASIPPVRNFITNRLTQLENNLVALNQTCVPITSPIEWQDIVINEFLADNDSIGGIADAAGDYDDWIELYNNSSNTVDLSDFYLSDDYAARKKWAFPTGTTIAPNEYLIIWADEDDGQDGLHATFKLSKSGEQLIFSHKDNTVIDSISYTTQTTNRSSARRPNGTGDFVIQQSTFAANNENLTSTNTAAANLTFKVYPNPTKDLIQIQLAQTTDQLSIDIHNLLGQSLYQQQFGNGGRNFTLDLSTLQTGIYWLNIRSGDQSGVKKLIIQR